MLWRRATQATRFTLRVGVPLVCRPVFAHSGATWHNQRFAAATGPSTTVTDIAYHVTHNGGRLPLGKIIHHVSASTKLAIFRSGKGIEGFIRTCDGELAIEVVNNEKVVVVSSKDLAERTSQMTSPPAVGGVTVVQLPKHDVPVTSKTATVAAAKADPPPPMPAAEPKPSATEKRLAPQPSVAAAPPTVPSTPKAASMGFAASGPGTPVVPTVEAATHPSVGTGGQDAASPAAASESAQSATPPLAGTISTVTANRTTASPSESPEEDRKDPNLVLRQRLIEVLSDATKYYNLNEVFSFLYKSSTQVKYADMLAYVKASERWFWYQKGHVARRLPGQTEMPPFVMASLAKPKGSSVAGKADATVTAADNFGGWGAQANIPTAEDIYEVLKYIPIHWVEVGHLTMPKEIRKKHVRVSSIVVWFERQPRYFELRLVGGSIEVRRSIVLHPEAHQLSKEQAEEYLAKRIAEKKESIVQQMQEFANNRGKMKAESLANATAGTSASRTLMPSAMSAQMEAVLKLIVRVCPGYPIPIAQILRRSSKKSITVDDIVQCLPSVENQVDRIDVVTEKGERGLFLRKKTGVDLSTWKEQFVADVSKATNLPALMSLMTLSCAQWDRTHFLYVRLTDDEKRAVDGFDGMVNILRQHPFVFKTGEYFYRRHNPSDPVSDADQEPTSNTQSSTIVLEENPYHNPRDLAVVFHYLTPDDQPSTLSHYVESSSPAMRAVLPPRLVTVVHAHPELFTCREITPGQFSIAKKVTNDDAQGDTGATLSREEVVQQVMKVVPVRGIDIGHLNNALPPALRNAVTRCFGASGLTGLVANYPQHFHVVHSPPYSTIFLKH